MTERQAQRFPLEWPLGWPRTKAGDRHPARFETTMSDSVDVAGKQFRRTIGRKPVTLPEAVSRLADELGRLGASAEVLSTNLPVRLDGVLRAAQGEPSDPGAAVYFRLDNTPQVFACDRWKRLADNVAAIALHIKALRAIERYGVGRRAQLFAGYAALTSGPDDWWLVLGIDRGSTIEDVESAYKRLAHEHHPDKAGGDHDRMTRLTAARSAARRALGA